MQQHKLDGWECGADRARTCGGAREQMRHNPAAPTDWAGRRVIAFALCARSVSHDSGMGTHKKFVDLCGVRSLTRVAQLCTPRSSRLAPLSVPPPRSFSVAMSAVSSVDVESLVYDRFMQYSGFGAKEKAGEIDSAAFAKLCRETGIISKACTKTDVDLVFTRAKAKGGRKLNYTQFTTALLYLGEKRFASVYKNDSKEAAQQSVMELIAASSGPRANATVPDAVKWHDDKSTYTGVYAQGGPTNNDRQWSGQSVRSSALVRRASSSLCDFCFSSRLIRPHHALKPRRPIGVGCAWTQAIMKRLSSRLPCIAPSCSPLDTAFDEPAPHFTASRRTPAWRSSEHLRRMSPRDRSRRTNQRIIQIKPK